MRGGREEKGEGEQRSLFNISRGLSSALGRPTSRSSLAATKGQVNFNYRKSNERPSRRGSRCLSCASTIIVEIGENVGANDGHGRDGVGRVSSEYARDRGNREISAALGLRSARKVTFIRIHGLEPAIFVAEIMATCNCFHDCSRLIAGLQTTTAGERDSTR